MPMVELYSSIKYWLSANRCYSAERVGFEWTPSMGVYGGRFFLPLLPLFGNRGSREGVNGVGCIRILIPL